MQLLHGAAKNTLQKDVHASYRHNGTYWNINAKNVVLVLVDLVDHSRTIAITKNCESDWSVWAVFLTSRTI